MEEVKYVETNQEVHALQAQCELQIGATWNLVRTTLHEWDTNPNDPPNEYSHDKKGMLRVAMVELLQSPLPYNGQYHELHHCYS